MPKYTMPDGNAYDFADDAQATEAMDAWGKQFGGGPSTMDKIGSGLSVAGRTAAGLAGAIPQGLRALGNIATGGDPSTAWQESESSNFANMLPEGNKLTQQYQQNVGDVFDRFTEATGRAMAGDNREQIARLQAEYEKSNELEKLLLKEQLDFALADENASRFHGEILGNLLPMGPAAKAAKGKPKANLSPTASKLDAVRAEVNPDSKNNWQEINALDEQLNKGTSTAYGKSGQGKWMLDENGMPVRETLTPPEVPGATPAGPHVRLNPGETNGGVPRRMGVSETPEEIAFWKNRADQMTEDARNNPIPAEGGIAGTDPFIVEQAKRKQQEAIAEFNARRAQESQIPIPLREGEQAQGPYSQLAPKLNEPVPPTLPEQPGRTPFPEITDPGEVGASLQKAGPEPVPLVQGGIERSFDGINQPRERGNGRLSNLPNTDTGFGFEPRRPAPSQGAALVEALKRQRQENAGGFPFKDRISHLTDDPMAQQLLRELDQRLSEARRGEPGASARARALENQLANHGFDANHPWTTGEKTVPPVQHSTAVNGLSVFDKKSTALPIEKTMSLKDHAANVVDAIAEATGAKLNFGPGTKLGDALHGLAVALVDEGIKTGIAAARRAKEILGSAWNKVKEGFGVAWQRAMAHDPSSRQRGAVEGMGNSLLVKAWDRLAGKKEEASTFEKKASVEAATKSLPGVSSVYDGVTRQGTDVPEVLNNNKDFNKDLTNTELTAGKTVVSGANIMAKASKNPFIRSVYEMWDGGTKAALKLIDTNVIPAEKLIKDLGEQSRIDVAALLKEYEGVGTVSSETLRRAGYSLPEIRAYEAHTNMMASALERMNADRVAAGKKPLTAREGFAASTFRGAFKTVVRDEHNRPVYVVAANTARGHKALLEMFKERFGEKFKFETQDPKTFRAFKSKEAQADFFYDQFMKDIAAEDPRAQAIQSAFEEWKRNHAEYDMGVNQHLKNKSEVAVGGAEGLRFEKNALENANAYLESQLRYAENSFIWAEHQTAFRTTGELMKGLDRLPNTVDYLDAYRQNAIGMRQNIIGEISQAARLDSYYGTRGSSWIKAGLNSTLLGGPLNLAFIGTQLLQTINTIPEIISIKNRLGRNEILALSYDVPKAAVGVVAELTKSAIRWESPALQWAVDNHVIRPARFEDVGVINTPAVVKGASVVWNGPVKAADLGGRGIAYLAFVDAFKKHFKGDEVFRMAADAVERSMVDYRDFESPMVGSSGGTLGKGIMFLHKYPANWVNQLVGFAKQKEFTPFVALLGTSFFTAGVAGMIGVGLYDRIAEAMDWPSVKEMLFKANAPTWVTMGPLSAWTGIDTQAKTSMADLFPDTLGDAMLPGSGFATNIVKDAFDKKVPWSGVAQTALPASMKGLSETQFFEQPSHDPAKPHIRESINPKNRDSVYERDQTNKYFFNTMNESDLRMISARSTKESEWKQKEYIVSKQKAREFNQAEGMINKYKEAIQHAEGNPFALRRANEDLLKGWQAKNLNMSDIEQKLVKAHGEAFLPQDVRELLKAQSNPENFIKGEAIRHGVR